MRYHLPLVLPVAQLLVCVVVLWPIRGRLLCGLYDSTQFYTAILPIRNGLAVAIPNRIAVAAPRGSQTERHSSNRAPRAAVILPYNAKSVAEKRETGGIRMDWIFASCHGEQTSADLSRNSRKTGNREGRTAGHAGRCAKATHGSHMLCL